MIQPIRFEILDEILEFSPNRAEKPTHEKSSLARLITNSEHISKLFTTLKELKQLRFDEFDLLRDIREIVESDPGRFENIKVPSQYRREIRSKVLTKYLTPEFIRKVREKLITELLRFSKQQKDQDALMTAMVFLQSHTDLGVPCEYNPLWEIIFNLSIKDGIRFIDSLTALIEGLDTIKDKNPDVLTKDPPVLQVTKQICQWPIFWRQLIEYQDVVPVESLVSALLRGEMMIELYFDEIIHLPLFLYRQFKNDSYNEPLLLEKLSDIEKEEIAKIVFKNILKSAVIDLPPLISILKKRLHKAKKKALKDKNQEEAEQFNILVDSLNKKSENSLNTFLLTLLIAKISIKKYWENKRDFFFIFTIFKNPELPQNYYEYSQILNKLKLFDSIERVLTCAIEVDEQSFWGYWGLGKFYLKSNKLAESEKNYLTALKLAQHVEILTPGILKRELFLIKEDIKELNLKKIKQQADSQPQINLF